MQIGAVYAVVGVVEADVVIRGDLCHSAFHVLIRRGRQRHEFLALLFPIVAPVMRLLRERRVIEILQMQPEVAVELLQAEIVHLLHVMEEALFQNPDGVLNRALVLGLSHLCGQDDRVVVFGPLRIVLVQFRRDPVLVSDDGLLAVVADDKRRDTAKIQERIVVDGDPLRLLCGNHALRVDELRIRQHGYEDDDLYELTGEMIYHLKGLPSEIHLHLLSDDSVEVKRLLVFLAPLGIILTELSVGIELQPTVTTSLRVPVPEDDERHVLPGRHSFGNGLIVRQLIGEIAAGNCSIRTVNGGCNPIVCNSWRKRIAECLTGLKCPKKFVYTGFADTERLGDLPSAHSESIVLCNDVFVV